MEAKTLIYALADTLAEANAETQDEKLGDIKAEKLVH